LIEPVSVPLIASFELGGATAAFTGRSGGVSTGSFSELNLGGHVGDEPEVVRANRDLLAASVGLSRHVGMNQVHGTEVVSPSPDVRCSDEAWGETVGDADSLVTTQLNVGLVALTADCLPIALGTKDAVAVIHAGWRGLSSGVVENAVAALREVSSGPIAAAIGPCAGVCCYEVSIEVLNAFSPAACFEGRMLNLGATAEDRLNRAGVNLVHRLSVCTICDGDGRFFSHRRDGVPTGRQGVIAWLNS